MTQYKYLKGEISARNGGGVLLEVSEDTGAFYTLNKLWRPYCTRWFKFDSIEDLKTFVNFCTLAIREYEKNADALRLRKSSSESCGQMSEVMAGVEKK